MIILGSGGSLPVSGLSGVFTSLGFPFRSSLPFSQVIFPEFGGGGLFYSLTFFLLTLCLINLRACAAKRFPSFL